MAYTNTKDGKVEAPDWYRNSDGSVPSTMQKGLTKEQWEAQNASVKREKEQEAARQEAKERANNHIASGGTKFDQGYQQILDDTGVSNHQIQKSQRADKKAEMEKNKKAKVDEAYAYKNYRKDLQNSSNQSMSQVVDVSDYYTKQLASGAYKDQDTSKLQTMINSGQKFTNTEARRALSGNPEDSNLYKGAGGYENWSNMFKDGGQFQSQYNQDEYLTQAQANQNRSQHLEDRKNFFEGSGAKKYQKYDFFNNDKYRFDQMRNNFNS